jgi:hypothetical protein
MTRKAKWSSSKPSIVSVSTSGVATGKAPGSATVKATANGRSASIRVTVGEPSMGPLRVSKTNPRYFVDGAGRTVYLAGFHTWDDLMDSGKSDPPPRFDYNRFLNELETRGLNLTRLWLWEQANLTTDVEGNYPFEPTIYVRTGPGNGNDGKPRFDLTKFNEAFFDRLRERVIAARERGIYTIVMLFQGWSLDVKGRGFNPWPGHPYNGQNNINGINGDADGDGQGGETHTLGNPEITRLQEEYVRRVIDAVGDQPNVLYEISNESNPGSYPWQEHMTDVIRQYEATKPMQHPVGITAEYFNFENEQLFGTNADWIAPSWGGQIDDPPAGDGRKVIVADTDHLCGVCGDGAFPWKAMTRGLNPFFMDPWEGKAVGLGGLDQPADLPEWDQMRRALGATRVVARKLDFAHMTPQGDLASTGFCLADASRNGAYLVYLDEGGSTEVDLSATPGTLTVEWIRPATGAVAERTTVQGGATRKLSAPFGGDAVLLIRAAGESG